MADHEHSLSIADARKLVEELDHTRYRLSPGLALRVPHVEVPRTVGIEIALRIAVQTAVIALTEPRVAEDRDIEAGEGDVNSLNGATQVRHIDGGNPIVAATVAKLSRQLPPALRQLPVKPSGRATRLVVDGQRMRLVHDLNRHSSPLPSSRRDPRRLGLGEPYVGR